MNIKLKDGSMVILVNENDYMLESDPCSWVSICPMMQNGLRPNCGPWCPAFKNNDIMNIKDAKIWWMHQAINKEELDEPYL